jgi:hypothetical protein
MIAGDQRVDKQGWIALNQKSKHLCEVFLGEK